MISTNVPSRAGERYQPASSAVASPARASFDVRLQTRPTSSSSGLGVVNWETTTATVTPTTNAAIAPRKLPAWSDSVSTSRVTSTLTAIAAAVPEISPIQADGPVIRFQ